MDAKLAKFDVEIMIEMNEKSKALPPDNVDWAAIEEGAAKALPACAAHIKSLSGFLRNYSGDLLPALAAWLATVGPTGMLGGEYVDAINCIRIPVGQKGIPYVAYALIKAQKISPKLVDGVCKSIPANKNQQPE